MGRVTHTPKRVLTNRPVLRANRLLRSSRPLSEEGGAAFRPTVYATLWPMGISNTLFLVAVATGLAPVMALRLNAPASIIDLVKGLAAGAVTLVVSWQLADRVHPFRLYEVMHLVYLLVVVTLPVMLGSWFVASALRRQRSRAASLCGGAATVFLLLGIWGTHIEPNWLRVDRETIRAEVAAPIRIGVLADLQTPNVGDIEWAAVEALIADEPDLVVVPGDLFQGPWDVIEENSPDFQALLTALVDTTELVVVVSGDSDTTGQLEPLVRAAGARYIDNQILDVTIGGQTVRLAGVAVHPSEAKDAVIAALAAPTDSFSVLVSHRPGITYALPSGSDVDLIVAGHTHGGQIQLPVISNYIWYSDVPARIANGGLNRLRDFNLYVSTGVGMERHASPQVRFGVRPEVGIIDVVPNS